MEVMAADLVAVEQRRATWTVEARELLQAWAWANSQGSDGIRAASGKACAIQARMAGVSVSTPRSVTSAGTLPLGFTAR